MKTTSSDRTLESFKIFPIIAWIITIGFAVFVYNIALELKAVAADLEKQTQFLQERASMSPQEIENFEAEKPVR
ncbi:hypothetical protein GW766_01940 [Candidatus Parcubacteria bacterium]|nr:hypothetical protein [Candidatus Parcubacteria bacterium]